MTPNPEPTEPDPIRVVAITVSTSLAHGPEGDRGGDALIELIESFGGGLVGREILPDSREVIAERLRYWTDAFGCDLILTTGGTGFSPNDLTPEATEDVIERRVPGIPEAMRAASAPHTRHWMLSRATAGIRGSTLIVNFPGSPKSIAETGEAIVPALSHAISLLRGEASRH